MKKSLYNIFTRSLPLLRRGLGGGLLLLLFLLFGEGWGGAVFAQKQGQERIDSLKTELKIIKADTGKVNISNDLCRQFWQSGDYLAAQKYAQDALIYAQKIKYPKGEAEAYRNIGNIYNDRGNYQKALDDHSAALKIYEAIGDSNGIAACYNNIGNVFYGRGNYSEALKNYFSALKINKETGNKNWSAINYDNIGGIYYLLGNYPEALKNYLAALKIYEDDSSGSAEDKNEIAAAYINVGTVYSAQKNNTEALKNYFAALKINEGTGNNNGIATAYNNIGSVYHAHYNYSKALKNYFAALKIIEHISTGSIGDKSGIAAAYNNIGAVYYARGAYAEALKNYFVSLKTNEATGDKYGTALYYNNIGLAYVKLNQVKESKTWLRKGLNMSMQIGAKEWIKESYRGLASADSAQGNYNAALENYKMFIRYRDSIYNEDNTKKLTQAAMQYEFDKKQMADSLQSAQVQALAAERLKKQQTYTAMGAGLVVLLLGFSGLVFRNNKKLAAEKQKSESLLHNILPEEISIDLKERGATTAKEFDAVTVLFTDFVNFTQAAEQLSPQALVQELHECFTAFDHIIERNGLEKIKTVGDAYLAVCGLPTADPHHAQKTVQAALEIRDFISDREKASPKGRFGGAFEIRIGIHSGPVVAGIVGVKKFAYDIWGDTVNTAARMEQSGEAGKVNISETTFHLVKGVFACGHRGLVMAKNKGVLDMYFVEKNKEI